MSGSPQVLAMHRSPRYFWRSAFFLLVLAAASLRGRQPAVHAAEVDFETDIRPIFTQHCIQCHGEDIREGGLRLTDRDSALQPSDSGASAIVPHQPHCSELVSRIESLDDDLRMPKDAPQLSQIEIDLLIRWIRSGADWPTDSSSSKHWSYIAPLRPDIPANHPPFVSGTWCRNEIDRFIQRQLQRVGLWPSPPAAPAILIRRLYLDLVGIPPHPDQVAEFVSNPSDEAYEAIVDELLTSERYGEKWARHWLDLARYADSNGYQADQIRHLWAYRDWIIRAFNEDMPFDQFTMEQLAGDLIPDGTLDHAIATGFHRATTCNVEAGVDPEGNRTNQVIDRVNTTATIWLGTTLECAQCHNHKYDPFSQREYYQLFAFFNNTPLEVENSGRSQVQFNLAGPKMDLPMTEKQIKTKDLLIQLIEGLRRKKAAVETQALTEQRTWETATRKTPPKDLPKNIARALAKPHSQRRSRQKEVIREYFLNHHEDVKPVREKLAKWEQKLAHMVPYTTLVMSELSEPRETRVLMRGQYQDLGERVHADVPSTLHPFPSDAPRNRLGLAQWLISCDNPLVARVTVNRWWQEFFGNGIVETSNDFGAQGEPPTHPDLLDWLAVEFMENGWSMKHIHREIVTSSTYRQSSRITSRARRIDPENRLLSRAPRLRLPAELIRDNALAIAGLLTHHVGGTPVFPPQPEGIWRQIGRKKDEPGYRPSTGDNRYRRGVYVVWRRAAPYPSFVNFDAPDRTFCIAKRPNTNTPLQALTLLNDETYVEAAQALAARVLNEKQDAGDLARLRYAFQLCVAREPNEEELSVLAEALHAERCLLESAPDQVDAMLTERAATFVGELDHTEWAAWFCVANTLLNLDETINRR